MSEINKNNSQERAPLVLSARQAASVLNISVWSLNRLVREKHIKTLPGFRSARKFSEREILRYAYGLTQI